MGHEMIVMVHEINRNKYIKDDEKLRYNPRIVLIIFLKDYLQ